MDVLSSQPPPGKGHLPQCWYHTLQSRHLPRIWLNRIELTDHFWWLHCLQFGHCFDFSIFQCCVPKNRYKISFITFPSHFYDNEMIPKGKKMNYFGKLELQFAYYFLSRHHISITFLWQFDGIIHSAIFFKSHFHTNVMKMWWNSRQVLIFKN